jgi:hypothetical protein
LWGLGGEVRDGEEARGLYRGGLRWFGGYLPGDPAAVRQGGAAVTGLQVK